MNKKGNKVHRKKNYNYTEKKDKVQKILGEIKEGKTEAKNITDLMEQAGYADSTANKDMKSRESVAEIVRREIPIEDRVEVIKQIIYVGSKDKSGKKIKTGIEHIHPAIVANKLKAITLVNKMDGSFAPTEIKINPFDDTDTTPNSEYLDFIKKKKRK